MEVELKGMLADEEDLVVEIFMTDWRQFKTIITPLLDFSVDPLHIHGHPRMKSAVEPSSTIKEILS